MTKDDKVASAVEQEHYPYRPGAIIHANLYVEDSTDKKDDTDDPTREPEETAEQNPIPISMTVVRTFSTTLSCVLLVDVSDGYQLPTLSPPASTKLPSTSKAVLKLCDRRFSAGLREDYDASVWTPKIEKKHRRFMGIPEHVRPECSAEDGNNSWLYCSSDEDGPNSEGTPKRHGALSLSEGKGILEPKKRRISNKHWSAGHREAYVEQVAQKLYRTEVEVYRELRALQGEEVPYVYGTIRVQDIGGKGLGGGVEIRGILMQHIDASFSLRDVPDRIPNQTLWQEVGEAAVKVVQVVGDCGVLNDDVRLDNILVVPITMKDKEERSATRGEGVERFGMDSEEQTKPSTQRFRTVMIDFGLARAQRKDESDEEFRKERRQQDEEGAVGYILEKHLMKAVKGSHSSRQEKRSFKYRPSNRLLRPWDNDEADLW